MWCCLLLPLRLNPSVGQYPTTLFPGFPCDVACPSQVEPKLAASSMDQVLSICQSLTTLGYLPGPGWHAALVASARAPPQQLTAGRLEQLLLCSAAMQARLPDDLLQVCRAFSPVLVATPVPRGWSSAACYRLLCNRHTHASVTSRIPMRHMRHLHSVLAELPASLCCI